MLVERIRSLFRTRLDYRWVRDVVRQIESWKYHDAHIWDPEHGRRLIFEACLSGRPHAIGKLGSAELGAIRKYFRWANHPQREEQTALDRQVLCTNAGVFPDSYQTLEVFSQLMTRQVLPELTLIGVWFNLGEAGIIKRYAPNANHIAFGSFEVFGITGWRWTKALAGKRVLILHPFEATIRMQYAKRLQVWNGQEDILPEFELLTIKVPFSPALVPSMHPDWLTTLNDLRQQMSTLQFDVALIGAGAYSLPLAVHAKKMNRIGIHLGGVTQLYFGIMGGRWDNDPSIQALANEYWVRPLPEDTPTNNALIEGGCYW